jgi:hypothetical protein
MDHTEHYEETLPDEALLFDYVYVDFAKKVKDLSLQGLSETEFAIPQELRDPVAHLLYMTRDEWNRFRGRYMDYAVRKLAKNFRVIGTDSSTGTVSVSWRKE